MFTGLIESLGETELITSDLLRVSLGAPQSAAILTDMAIGDSVAVDGICLTVSKILNNGFIASVSPETLQRSTLGNPLKSAPIVNLETSLRLGSKLGGHFVTGHIDGIACLQEVTTTANAWEMTFTAPESLVSQWQETISPYLVAKGSIGVNGISLTIAKCDSRGDWFTVAVIPHTYEHTNLFQLQPGNWVNIEADILGKYVHKILQQRWQGQIPSNQGLDDNFLAEHGYL